MASKKTGKYLRWAREHAIAGYQKSCIECCWFSREYPDLRCLKWSKDVRPENPACYYFSRKAKNGNHLREYIMGEKGNGKYLEDYGYVLDYLPYGHPDFKKPLHKSEPLAQIIGESRFTLLEVSIKKGADVKIGDRVYIGKGEREVVNKIKRRLRYDQLTSMSKSALTDILKEIVSKNESNLVNIFNRAGPITHKLHMLSLLADVNEVKVRSIVEQREKKPFEGFLDVSTRTKLKTPARAISNRVLCELKSPVKYYLFL